ncbi:hypothetical protein EMIHUDRAFT_42969, partial [Emiliania huxleyi CCMP1516]|uniref:ferredoxin--NADP(+) reductase n=2 Tax=Emiliania huxleyi TaxID=2903 RepID=A0A0D3KM75_EMIH1
LECDPYHAIAANLPLNTYKNKAPLAGAIISAKRIVGPAAPGEVCHIRIGTGDNFRYWEGQSLGVIPPGPNAVRLYSIASTRYGDDAKGSSVSLCVRRALYWDADTGAHDPAKKGVCSNFLRARAGRARRGRVHDTCDSSPGDEVHLTGPTGKVMLMPEHEPATDLIMLATGTGIAPYRGFLRRLFLEPTPAADAFRGLAWLFLGVANRDALLYDDEWQAILQRETARGRSAAQGREDGARRRSATRPVGGKMYIQDKVAQHADEVFERMDNGAHMYFCGLKGMMPGITEMLEGVCKEKGLVWEDKLSEWKKAGQWHVEVY